MKLIDLTGKRFGRWTVLALHPERNGESRAHWHCRCDCGTERAVRGKDLRNGKSSSCGCLRHASAIDLSGQRFGKWTVIGMHPERYRRAVVWTCRCDCGTERLVAGWLLRNGDSKSCGCVGLEKLRKRLTTHGLSKTRVYSIWTGMKQRCLNPNCPDYPNYGGRGITCEPYLSFMSFYADKGEPPPNKSLDRINVNGNYEPRNVRWATFWEQARNKRNSRRP